MTSIAFRFSCWLSVWTMMLDTLISCASLLRETEMFIISFVIAVDYSSDFRLPFPTFKIKWFGFWRSNGFKKSFSIALLRQRSVKKKTPTHVFSWKFFKNFEKKSFSVEHIGAIASVHCQGKSFPDCHQNTSLEKK